MAKLPMDLRHFKKKAEDKHTTTLEHKDGHSLRIAHGALGDDIRKQLSALPMNTGGNVQQSPTPKQNAESMSKGFTTPSDGAISQFFGGVKDKVMGKAHGGEINPKLEQSKIEPSKQKSFEHYAQGTPDGGASNSDSSQPQSPVVINVGGAGTQAPQAIPQQFINPNPGAQAAAQNPQPQPDMSPQTQDVYGVSKEAQAKMAVEAQNSQPQPGTQMPNQPSVAPQEGDQAQPAANPDPYGADQAANTFNTGLGNAQAGIGLQGGAEAQVGAAQAQALQSQVAQQQQTQHTYNDHVRQLELERESFRNDVDANHIDPNHYLNSLGTGSKIATGIGLILGGMGAGATGAPNAALEFLNKQIDRDIDAQKTDLGKKENLLNANLRQFGNLRDATDMTRIMQSDILSNRLKKAAADAATPMAAANALKASGQLDMSSAQTQAQMAMRKTMMQNMNAGGDDSDPQKTDARVGAQARMYDMMGMHEQAKNLRDSYVPGVGQSASGTAVPDSARQQMIGIKNVNDLFNRSLEFSQKHAGTWSPTERAEAETIQQQLIGSIKQAQHDGVYKPSEADFLLGQIGGSPASAFAKFSSIPKIKELQQIKQQEFNELTKTYGIKPQPLAGTQEQAQPVSRQTADGKIALFDPNTKKFLGYK